MRVLVAEDERRLAHTLKQGLEQEGYAVDVTYHGGEAYDICQTETYDLMIIDVMMPVMDGVTFCQKIRKDGIKTPLLFLTAKSDIRDRVHGLDAGADDYLMKPFSFDELLARIRALLRRPHSVLTTILSVGDLTLDPGSFEVTRGGEPIKLTQKEFSLLEYLMRYPHVVQSKERILTHVWDYDTDILPNTIEVYIKNLRNKIDAAFPASKPLIHTVRGFGYKLTDRAN